MYTVAQSCIYNMYCKPCVRIYTYLYAVHETSNPGKYQTCFRSTGTGVICHQHVRMHTIHITNILCIWSADMMITSWDYIVITGSSKVLAEKVAWLFRWPGPETCYVVVYQAYKTENGNSSAVFIWINLGETEESMFKINGTVYDWNLITTLPHLSNVCMSSPPSVASPIIALLFTNRFFGRPWYHCLLAGEKSEKFSFLKMGVSWTPTQGFLGILLASFSCTSLLVPPTGATTPQMDGGMVHEVPNTSANDTISTFVRPGWDSVERSIQVL